MTRLPVRRVEAGEWAQDEVPADRWPGTLGPVAHLLRVGVDLGPATIVVGENGTGKSTLVEAIAEAYGLPAAGGAPRRGRQQSVTALAPALRLLRDRGAPRHGLFLRSEAPEQGHGVVRLNEVDGPRPGARSHELSHGESFLSSLAARCAEPGLVVLEERESGLSFTSCLTLVTLLADVVAGGSQVLVATHSPVVAALPGATILELDAEGIRTVAWADLELVRHQRRFLDAPEAYLRHLRE
jgi:predicted ATPase